MASELQLSVPERRGTGAFKWDLAAEGELPMWVADMDFAVAPEITAALAERIAHPVFGYAGVPRSYRDALAAWLAERHAWELDPRALTVMPSVMAAMSMIVDELTAPGDRVVTFAPVYGPFDRVVRGQGRELVRVPLRQTRAADGGVQYAMDPQALEHALADGPRASLLLLCSPHNPGGRVWSPQELAAVRDVAARAGVPVLADEIHADLTFPGAVMTPWLSLGAATERDTALIAPSKTFNIPGLPTATAIAAGEPWRRRLRELLEVRKLDLPNLLAMTAAEAAYRHGGGWLDAVRGTIRQHYERVRAELSDLDGVRVHSMEGTFIVWIDAGERWGVGAGDGASPGAGGVAQGGAMPEAGGVAEGGATPEPAAAIPGAGADSVSERFQAHARSHGLWLSAGTEFGAEGEGFMRMNVATSAERLAQGLERLRVALASFPSG